MYEHGWWWEERQAPLDHVGPPVSAVGLVLYRGMHSFMISHSPSSPALLVLVLCGTVNCSCALEWVNDWLWNVCLISCFSLFWVFAESLSHVCACIFVLWILVVRHVEYYYQSIFHGLIVWLPRARCLNCHIICLLLLSPVPINWFLQFIFWLLSLSGWDSSL